MQTKEQIQEVARTWKVPAGFVDSEANGTTLAQCIQQDFGGVFSHANLDAAVAKLGDKLGYNIRVVERAPTQTQATVDAIYREWVAKYAPKDLKQIPENTAILSTYVNTYFAGAYSITSLTEAEKNAHGLAYRSDAEKAKKQEDKMNKDRIASKPQNSKADLEGRATTQRNQEEIAKIDAINKEIASFINRYTCNNSNGLGKNFSLTEERCGEMKKIGDGFGKTLKDREAALKAVKAKYFTYPS